MDFRKTSDSLERLATIVWVLSILAAISIIILGMKACSYGKVAGTYSYYREEAPEYFIYSVIIAVATLLNGAIFSNILDGIACIVCNTGNAESEIRSIKNLLETKNEQSSVSSYNNNLPNM